MAAAAAVAVGAAAAVGCCSECVQRVLADCLLLACCLLAVGRKRVGIAGWLTDSHPPTSLLSLLSSGFFKGMFMHMCVCLILVPSSFCFVWTE